MDFYCDLFDTNEDELERFIDVLSSNMEQSQLYILSTRWKHITVARRRELAVKYATERYSKNFVIFMNYFSTLIGRFEDDQE